MSESLAAHLYTAHQRALGDTDDKPLSAASPRLQRQYHRFADELEKLTASDRAELEQHRPSDRRRARLQNETVQWLRRELAAAEAGRDRLAEQLDGIEARVHHAFAHADERGVFLDGLTTGELTRIVMNAVRDQIPAIREADRDG